MLIDNKYNANSSDYWIKFAIYYSLSILVYDNNNKTKEFFNLDLRLKIINKFH